jgi:hypothetical protein
LNKKIKYQISQFSPSLAHSARVHGLCHVLALVRPVPVFFSLDPGWKLICAVGADLGEVGGGALHERVCVKVAGKQLRAREGPRALQAARQDLLRLPYFAISWSFGLLLKEREREMSLSS